jgi:Helix-turn-helix domain of resolvase
MASRNVDLRNSGQAERGICYFPFRRRENWSHGCQWRRVIRSTLKGHEISFDLWNYTSCEIFPIEEETVVRDRRYADGVLAELERSLIVERTPAGVKVAQKRGVKFGRKVKLTPDRLAHARKLIEQGTRPTDAAKIIGIGRTTLYDALQREAA